MQNVELTPWPRGMSRIEAARYVGVGVDKFDEMVADKRMPPPREINRRLVWDRVEVDIAFTAIPHRGISRHVFD